MGKKDIDMGGWFPPQRLIVRLTPCLPARIDVTPPEERQSGLGNMLMIGFLLASVQADPATGLQSESGMLERA